MDRNGEWSSAVQPQLQASEPACQQRIPSHPPLTSPSIGGAGGNAWWRTRADPLLAGCVALRNAGHRLPDVRADCCWCQPCCAAAGVSCSVLRCLQLGCLQLRMAAARSAVPGSLLATYPPHLGAALRVLLLQVEAERGLRQCVSRGEGGTGCGQPQHWLHLPGKLWAVGRGCLVAVRLARLDRERRERNVCCCVGVAWCKCAAAAV